MLNIVDKYSVETEVQNEEGVVAIEYVVVAGATVAALLAIWGLFGQTLSDKLDDIISTIPGV